MSSPSTESMAVMVERFFEHVLSLPSGYSYQKHKGKLFIPVAGKSEWRIMLRDLATGENHPVFLTSEFLDNLTKALAATQQQFEQVVPQKVIQ